MHAGGWLLCFRNTECHKKKEETERQRLRGDKNAESVMLQEREMGEKTNENKGNRKAKCSLKVPDRNVLI